MPVYPQSRSGILCKLLEQERRGEPMHEIGLYPDETMASGIAAQNEFFHSLSNLLNEHAAEHPETNRQQILRHKQSWR